MRIRALAGAIPRQPPTEIKLWNAGPNPTDYGVHVWNERSVSEVMSRYNERGNPILLDVEHNGAQMTSGEPADTAGYARLELRSGEPWLIFDWSDFGREQIASGARRFLSPEYDVDKNTGEILALYRVSLVADPGTHRARMLAAAATERTPNMDLAVILAALRAALAAEDPAVAKESIANLVSELEGQSAGAPTESDPPAAAPTADDVSAEAAGEENDEEEKTTMTTTTKTSAKPVPAPPSTDKVSAAADEAVKLIQNSTRDHLIATQGSKLDPSIRRWASSQPLEVVKGLLEAAPEKDEAKKRAAATRGPASGSNEHGLTDREIQKCKARGLDPAKYAKTKAASIAASTPTGEVI